MPNREIFGVDPDTVRITVVGGPLDDPFIEKIVLDDDSNHGKSCGLAFRGMCEFIGESKDRTGHNPVMYLEAPVVGRGGPGPTISQSFIGGALLAAFEEMGATYSHVNNQTWKKQGLGNGNIGKDEIALRMKEKWPKLFEIARGELPCPGTPGGGPFRDQNTLDAGGIYLFGVHNYELKRRIMKRRSRGN